MQILKQIADQKILVVGDVMLDRYCWGTVTRISPEAPVPIVEIEKTSLVAGGAANVAANLAGLGVRPYLFGIKGDDSEGERMDSILSEAGIGDHFITTIKGRKTTCKTRIVAHNQHVVRMDQESTAPISNEAADAILMQMINLLGDMDAVVVSDYAKGFLTDHLLLELINKARERGKLLIADPKGRNFEKYKGATAVTPNRREAADACAIDAASSDAVSRSGEMLMRSLDLKALLITEGEEGMSVFQGGARTHFPSLARDIFDVTGAGDTVIAAFTAALAAGSDFLTSAKLANAAAGLVVGHIGTTRITSEMLTEFLNSGEYDQLFESSHA